MKKIVLAFALIGATLLGACSDADIASRNISRAADQFEVTRRVVFINGITDTYVLSVEGKCSIHKDNMDKQLEVTCKTAEDTYKKHYLGISDNLTYFAEQLEPIPVGTYHYRVIFKPQTIIPDIDLRTSGKELLQ